MFRAALLGGRGEFTAAAEQIVAARTLFKRQSPDGAIPAVVTLVGGLTAQHVAVDWPRLATMMWNLAQEPQGSGNARTGVCRVRRAGLCVRGRGRPGALGPGPHPPGAEFGRARDQRRGRSGRRRGVGAARPGPRSATATARSGARRRRRIRVLYDLDGANGGAAERGAGPLPSGRRLLPACPRHARTARPAGGAGDRRLRRGARTAVARAARFHQAAGRRERPLPRARDARVVAPRRAPGKSQTLSLPIATAKAPGSSGCVARRERGAAAMVRAPLGCPGL